jgi:hypothetical protein
LTFNTIDDSMVVAQPGLALLREAVVANVDDGCALSTSRSNRAIEMLAQLGLDAVDVRLVSEHRSAMVQTDDRA